MHQNPSYQPAIDTVPATPTTRRRGKTASTAIVVIVTLVAMFAGRVALGIMRANNQPKRTPPVTIVQPNAVTTTVPSVPSSNPSRPAR